MAIPNPKVKRGFKQQTTTPTRKVMLGGIAGALTTIILYFLNTFAMPEGKQITGDVGAAITTLLTFVISYLVLPGASDQIVEA